MQQIKKRIPGSLFALSLAIAITACQPRPGQNTARTPSTDPPNIIFLMDDQHRWDALGMVNKQVLTPTLDQLAAEGVFFDQAVCQAPMCVPSRNSMMFGLYPNQTGVFRNNGGIKDEEMPGKTLAQYLADAGYETAGFGKTHWGKYLTDTRGFQTRFDAELPEKGAIIMAESDSLDKARYDAEIAPLGPGEENNLGYLGFTSALPEETHRDGWILKQCLRFIENRTSKKPLFLYLSFMKPHAGHNVPVGYESLYDTASIQYAKQPPWAEDYSPHALGVNRRDLYIDYWKNAPASEWKLMTMRYFANVTWMDDMMGRALQALRQKGILDNAIILYTSDHGEMLGERYYRFNKYNLYESSIRVPLLLAGSRLPRSLRGTTDARPAELVDILPTLLSVAGVSTGGSLPGVDLLKAPVKKASFASLYERPDEAAFMWRTQTHKLILVLDRKDFQIQTYTPADIRTGELYDLRNDPAEWNDLYGKPEKAALQAEYTSALLAHLRQMPNTSKPR